MKQHAVYLAIIAVLAVLLVYAAARAVRAGRALADVEARFGVGDGGHLAAPRARALRSAAADLLAERTYDGYRKEVDEAIRRAHEMGDFGEKSKLSDACAMALTGGKRLRAIITLEVARAAMAAAAAPARRGKPPPPLAPVDAMEAALFIEYVHAAALVVDDLPCFDDDDLRRGGPSLHAAVGPAVAQLAALALVAAAYQNICRQVDWIRANCPDTRNADRVGMQICGEASRAMGAMGAAGGQYMDISDAGTLAEEFSREGVGKITYRKTATFFEVACVAGWLAGGGAGAERETLREIGRLVGTAFQIADDIGDLEADSARALSGKPGWNFAATYGREVALRELDRHLRGAQLLLDQEGLWTPLWETELYPKIRAMASPAGQENEAAHRKAGAPAAGAAGLPTFADLAGPRGRPAALASSAQSSAVPASGRSEPPALSEPLTPGERPEPAVAGPEPSPAGPEPSPSHPELAEEALGEPQGSSP